MSLCERRISQFDGAACLLLNYASVLPNAVPRIRMPKVTTRRAIVLIVDVEPDGRAILDRANGWKGSVDALRHLRRLRDELAAATRMPVNFNWFIRADPQIAGTWGRADWVAEACPDIIRDIEMHNDFRGIHVHTWRWNDASKTWFAELRDAAWIEQCVTSSIDAFTKIFGSAPTANRFGDRWISSDAVGILRRCGIQYDLTVEPGLPDMPIHDDPRATGSLPDFRGAPREPYSPLGNDYMLAAPDPDPNDLWMLPLTTTKIAWRLVRRLPYVVRGSHSPNLALDHSTVWRHIRTTLDRPSHNPVVIVMRSGDLSSGKFLRNFLRTTAELARHPALAYCEFVPADEAISRWRAASHQGPFVPQ